jgi:hypothetical protein
MYDVEAMVTQTSPTVLKLTADWPVDWLRATSTRTIEIQRELPPGEFVEIPSVPTERAEINGNRGNWRKLRVGNRVVVRCFFPANEPKAEVHHEHPSLRRSRTVSGCRWKHSLYAGPTGPHQGAELPGGSRVISEATELLLSPFWPLLPYTLGT